MKRNATNQLSESTQSPYDLLLTTKRRRTSSISGRDVVLESESDRSRLVFSAPFRRLQQKAQVFSLESNAAVRSRLTHSLEVAQIGRFIADRITKWLLDEKFVTPPQARAYVTFIETACLMHDIGNPPFGHFGEAAISSWFLKNGEKYLSRTVDPTTLASGSNLNSTLGDFVEFDGNCQGLRIVSLLQWNNDEYGLNLTFSALAAYLKYIRGPKGTATYRDKEKFSKKPGFFSTEAALVKEIWSHFGYHADDPQRFPLAYVMEAADDIAYCISDLEDSIEKALLDHRIVFKELSTKWKKIIKSKDFKRDAHTDALTDIFTKASKSRENHSSTFTNFRTTLSQLLTIAAADSYTNHHDEVLSGRNTGLIDEKSSCGHALELLKTYCRENVYSHYSVHKIELSGYAAIIGLLENLSPLLSCTKERFNLALSGKKKDENQESIIIERKLLALFPEKHIRAYRASLDALENNSSLLENEKKLLEWNLRAHLIVDYISGMTDDFAFDTFQILTGIRAN